MKLQKLLSNSKKTVDSRMKLLRVNTDCCSSDNFSVCSDDTATTDARAETRNPSSKKMASAAVAMPIASSSITLAAAAITTKTETYQVSEAAFFKSLHAPPTKKSVRFNEHLCEVRATMHLNDMTPEEIEATWLTEEDFAHIQDRYELTLFLMETGGPLPKHQSARGLEGRTREGSELKAMIRNEAWDAVLDVQEFQWKQGYDDDEEIAAAYEQVSMEALQLAYDRAVLDELHAAAHQAKPKPSSSKSSKSSSSSSSKSSQSDNRRRRRISSSSQPKKVNISE